MSKCAEREKPEPITLDGIDGLRGVVAALRKELPSVVAVGEVANFAVRNPSSIKAQT